ncbi:glycogen synthase GlgA, partial [Clostridium cellulovorans]|uniref:Glycogen synthase n=1 Tax=Clostridium cellulovorans (strain ATCC 35296 / DSM 3052 / OCM 3 / 743B) TaxID=573061 RepID=D9SSS5_CLOC7
MKIAFIASEAAPFIKTGGLGDVVGSLPKYLNKIGNETIVILPNYVGIRHDLKESMDYIKEYYVPVGWRNMYCGVMHYKLDNVDFYFIDNQYYFYREGLYGYYDDGERFAFFDRAALMLLEQIDFKADVVHCHDWQTGMIPVFLKSQFWDNPFYQDMKSIFTIHNLQFQGVFPKNIIYELLGLPDHLFNNGSIEYHGKVSFLKSALVYSDKISTVSNSYAQEIQGQQFGEGLHGLLSSRRNDLWGIINGIDYSVYNPENDECIYYKYGGIYINDKYGNKARLQEDLNLWRSTDVPMIAMVTRLSDQKGLDLVVRCAEEILRRNVQLVILGTGDKYYEDYFKNLQYRYPGQVAALITFNEALSHKVYAASDIFLMPSAFEPCGLSQLIALKYGSLPLVRETGGLRDTVIPYNYGNHMGNGFMFKNNDNYALLSVLDRALSVYYHDTEEWQRIMRNGMFADYSWEKSSWIYNDLYNSVVWH